MRIDINADLGEGYGVYRIGDDATLLALVTSANVACGAHAGDPETMRRTVELAVAHGVSIGAHPGFADLQGFGRRPIRLPAREIEALVAAQIGALAAVAALAGARLAHVKAHGALNNMACDDRGYADAICAAIAAVDRSLAHLVMPGTELERATEAAGLTPVREAFVDRTYEPDGRLTSRGVEGAVIRDPALAAERAVRLATEGAVIARDGSTLVLAPQSLCVHGDEPTAVAVARAVRGALTAAGVTPTAATALLSGLRP